MITFQDYFSSSNLAQSLRLSPDGARVWDEVRNRWLILTPEEIVRQQLMTYLTRVLGFKAHLIGREVRIVGSRWRADIVVYDHCGNPLLIVECKAEQVAITQQVFEQAASYNATLRAPYLAVTNGRKLFCALIDHQSGVFSFCDLPHSS